jgi:hypothetical protein
VLVRVKRGALEAHVEAHRAADAALRLPLHSSRPREPVFLVVIGIHEGYAVLLRETDIFLLTQFILAQGMDVRVVEVDREVDAGGEHRLHDFAGARCAAGMEQHLGLAARRNKFLAFSLVHAGLPSRGGREPPGSENATEKARPIGPGFFFSPIIDLDEHQVRLTREPN